MAMTSARKLELGGGIATALFAGLNSFMSFSGSNRARLGAWDYLFVFLVWIALPLMVAIGAYLHAVKQKMWGITMLSVGGLFLALAFLYIIFVIAASWYIPTWVAVLAVMPSVMAVITVIAARARMVDRRAAQL
ncbi:MAG: hypothetical protein LC800_14770 [Acidobacteria bacterium]|nr:hypothetical protein [Acidobacteriota bacterium]